MMMEMTQHASDKPTLKLELIRCTSADEVEDVSFDQFQQWWYYKKHGRPKMPKCPRVFLQHLASVMSDMLKPYGKNEQVVGRHAQIPKEIADLDQSHLSYGERLAFVMTVSIIFLY